MFVCLLNNSKCCLSQMSLRVAHGDGHNTAKRGKRITVWSRIQCDHLNVWHCASIFPFKKFFSFPNSFAFAFVLPFLPLPCSFSFSFFIKIEVVVWRFWRFGFGFRTEFKKNLSTLFYFLYYGIWICGLNILMYRICIVVCTMYNTNA